VREIDPAEVCRRHGLRLEQVLEESSASLTARVRDEAGRELVLKRLPPDIGVGVRAGLEAWRESGVTPRLIAELAPDLVLLEWIEGTSMAGLPADEPPDAETVGRAIARLHRAEIPPGVPDVRDAFPRLTDDWGHLPDDLRPLAVELTAFLLAAEAAPSVLLHGDIVPYNVILTRQGPRLIDPLPARGFAGWDLAKPAVAWRALGRPGIVASLLRGYGAEPPLLAEVATWIALVYLQKNLPYPASPLRAHLLPLAEELSAAPVPETFLRTYL
jgi:Ser/Thr protein kinase RdoA (MazF antagonist)